MRILRNYILRELLGPFISSLIVFTFVMLMGNIIKLADMVINKGVGLIAVSRLVIYLLPYLFTYTIPMSLLTAILLSFGRLSADNEITAMRANGISVYRICLPTIILALIFSLICVIINDKAIPKAHFASRKALIEMGSKNPAAALEPGTFITTANNYIMFIYGMKKNKLSNIRIYQPQENQLTRTIIAKEGEFVPTDDKKSIRLKLMNGISDEPNPNDPNSFYKLNFQTYYITMQMDEGGKANIEKKPKDMTVSEIHNMIKKLKSSGRDVNRLKTELNKKFALAFASLVFVIMGLPLAIITRRHGKSVGFSIALFVIMLYYIISILFEALSTELSFFTGWSVWLPDVILFILGTILLHKTAKA